MNDFRTHEDHSAVNDEAPLSAPLSEAFAAAEQAVLELCSKTAASSHSLPGLVEFARVVVRIEVAASESLKLFGSLSREELAVLEQSDFAGPVRHDGISIYIVPYLPAPGWRVVNPADLL